MCAGVRKEILGSAAFSERLVDSYWQHHLMRSMHHPANPRFARTGPTVRPRAVGIMESRFSASTEG
jgi:hypothetical protein